MPIAKLDGRKLHKEKIMQNIHSIRLDGMLAFCGDFALIRTLPLPSSREVDHPSRRLLMTTGQ